MPKGIIDGSKALVFYSSVNKPGLNDATGAFIPEAKAFAKYHKIPADQVIGIDCIKNPMPVRAKKVLDNLKYWSQVFPEECPSISFFGHGWPSGIQFGFTKQNVEQLSQWIAYLAADNIKITFYACLTAENDVEDKEVKNIGPATDGGFSDMLRDALVFQKIDKGWVDGHKKGGHSTWNPWVIRFRCDAPSKSATGPYDAAGGCWLVEPGSEFWGRWVAALGEHGKTGLRYRFPFMSELEIKQELSK